MPDLADLADRAPTLTSRNLASGAGWVLRDIVCRAGPDDRDAEERHATMSISLVTQGSFRYRTDTGDVLLHAGSLLLGNAGACFECGHRHSRGDRCLALHFEVDLFSEMAASRAGGARFRFGQAMLPALRPLTPALARLQSYALAGAPMQQVEESAIALAARVLTTLSGTPPAAATPSARDHRRIAAVLRHMEETAAEPHSLDALASLACMSKYHFLRSFRRITGSTPYDYLISLRLRRAALRLRESHDGIAAIAFDCGFGDLSTFNAMFRDVFRASPGVWRTG
ncbi:AraC family transcriptional regulator [Ferrovibrio sp.]|uniref:AraC family transcriptional regulator n=1 Tax=Ferrovibrio sp. TaxID=1917215 RepID=UPI00311F4646